MRMHAYDVTLHSLTPYSHRQIITTEKLPRETDDAYEKRTYLERLHVTPEGFVFIPPLSFQLCLQATAKYLNERIPGKNTQTYTKNFVRGVICPEPLVLPITPDKTEPHWVFVPSNGIPGAGKRVWRCYCRIDRWEGTIPFVVVDDIITVDLLERYLRVAGQITGIGLWRPENRGMWGKFQVTEIRETTL
jgi:hypothetical protein